MKCQAKCHFRIFLHEWSWFAYEEKHFIRVFVFAFTRPIQIPILNNHIWFIGTYWLTWAGSASRYFWGLIILILHSYFRSSARRPNRKKWCFHQPKLEVGEPHTVSSLFWAVAPQQWLWVHLTIPFVIRHIKCQPLCLVSSIIINNSINYITKLHISYRLLPPFYNIQIQLLNRTSMTQLPCCPTKDY